MYPTHAKDYESNAYSSSQKWRPAEPYHPKKPCDAVVPPYDSDAKELWVLLNSAHSLQQTSQLISKLAWALFGLGGLIVLGSLLIAWTYPKVTQTNTTKEIINTTTKETTLKDSVKDTATNGHYSHPRGLW